jgi:hypothetical protein
MVGLYGVLADSTTQKTHETRIRRALDDPATLAATALLLTMTAGNRVLGSSAQGSAWRSIDCAPLRIDELP